MVKKKLTQLVAISAVSFAGFSGQALACSTSAWDSATAEAKSIVDGAIRYEGLCALDGTSGTAVKAVSGSGDTYIRAYVYADGASGQILKADALTATLNGTTLTVGGETTELTAKQWHQIQLQVTSAGTSVWVDKASTDTADITGATGVANVSEVTFGGATGGKLFIDSVVVSNGTAINDASVSLPDGTTTLVPGDSDGSGSIDAQDVYYVSQEIFSSLFGDYTDKEQYLKGVPDINKDGVVDSNDVYDISLKIFNDLFSGT